MLGWKSIGLVNGNSKFKFSIGTVIGKFHVQTYTPTYISYNGNWIFHIYPLNRYDRGHLQLVLVYQHACIHLHTHTTPSHSDTHIGTWNSNLKYYWTKTSQVDSAQVLAIVFWVIALKLYSMIAIVLFLNDRYPPR